MGLARTVDGKPSATKNKRTERLCIALLVFVLALGIFVRVWKLGSWPPLYGDEAAPGVLALRGLADDLTHIKGVRAYFSPLYVLMQMPFVSLLGNTIIALRLSSLVYGLLTILAAYFTARRLWGPRAGLMAAAAAAILPLSVVMGGRIGWEPALAFPIVAWALYFAVLAWQQHSIVAAIVCGALLALGTYAHPAVTLAIPGLLVGTIASGKLRPHLREAVVVAIVLAILSFPSTTLMRQLLTTGELNISAFTHVSAEMVKLRQTNSFSPREIGLNLFRTLDHFTGLVTTQYLLGPLNPPWSLPIKLFRVACVGLWLIIAFVSVRNGPLGRFLVGYVAGLFPVAHVTHPWFVVEPGHGRYLLAVAPLLPLLVIIAIRSKRNRLELIARHAAFVIFVMWVGATIVMLSFIHRDINGMDEIRTTVVGDPNRAAADFLVQHVDPAHDLILSRWCFYWPIKYYTQEQLPMFSSDLVWFDNQLVQVPETTGKRQVWGVQMPDDNPPPFAIEVLASWPSLNDPSHYYTIWIADEPQAAIEWALDDYQRRLAIHQRRFDTAD